MPRGADGSFEVTSGPLTLTFSNGTGLMTGARFSDGNGEDVVVDLAQTFGYYTSFDSGLESLDLGECDPETWAGCPDPATLPSAGNKEDAGGKHPTANSPTEEHRSLVRFLCGTPPGVFFWGT